jgi:glucosamine kinase
MIAPELFVGIDGGGSRATAVASDAAGRVLARLEGGAGLVRADAPLAGVDALAGLTRRVAHMAIPGAPVRGLCCGLAGVGRPRERDSVRAALMGSGVAQRVEIVTDVDAAMQDAFGSGPGLLLVAGTGSMAFGRTSDGRSARAGGWGAILGDEGGGWTISLAGMRAVLRHYDGRGQATVLAERLVEAAHCASPEELVSFAALSTKGDVAALTPIIAEAAAQGDAVAAAIIDEATAAHASLVAAVVRRLDPWPAAPPVGFAGGLIAPGRPLRERALAAISSVLQIADVLDRTVDGAVGAAAIARERAGQ